MQAPTGSAGSAIPSPDDILPPPPEEDRLSHGISAEEQAVSPVSRTEEEEPIGELPTDAGPLPEETGEVYPVATGEVLPVNTGDIEIEPAEELDEIEEELGRDSHKPPPPPAMSKAGRKVEARGVCDICGGDPVWYPDQQRWYCEHCRHFL